MLVVRSAEELYKMEREELRDICGAKDGIRLFSQLQKDRAEVML